MLQESSRYPWASPWHLLLRGFAPIFLIGGTQPVFLKSPQNNNPQGERGMSCQVSRKGLGGLLGYPMGDLWGESEV